MKRIKSFLTLLFVCVFIVGCSTLETPVTPEVIPTTVPQPTPDLDVFGSITSILDPVPAYQTYSVAPEEQIILIGNTAGLRSTTTFPSPSFGDQIRPPCEVGKVFKFTRNGFHFNWFPGMDWKSPGYHPGVDGWCVDPADTSPAVMGVPVKAPLPGISWRKGFLPISDTGSITNWVSGNVCFVMSDIDGMQILTVAGHFLDEVPNDEVVCPEPGQPVTYDSYLGRIGDTGRAYGAHLHLGFAIYNKGNLYWLNPEELGIIDNIRMPNEFYHNSYGGDLCSTPASVSVQKARQAAIAAGIPPEQFLALIFSESSFRPCYPDGRLLINPLNARCMGQIIPKYHPQYDPEKLVTDIDYCLQASAQIFVQYKELTGSWEGAVTKYKHAGPGTFEYSKYQDALNAGSFLDYVTGQTISLR